MNVGHRIAEARKEKRISQAELGAACGTTKQTIFKYENEIVTNIPLDRLEKIASVLDVSPAYLMGWDNNEAALIPNGAKREAPTPENGDGCPDPIIARIIEIVRQLSPETQQRCLEYFESLLALQNAAQAPNTQD